MARQACSSAAASGAVPAAVQRSAAQVSRTKFSTAAVTAAVYDKRALLACKKLAPRLPRRANTRARGRGLARSHDGLIRLFAVLPPRNQCDDRVQHVLPGPETTDLGC
jgi:hypothetical protein